MSAVTKYSIPEFMGVLQEMPKKLDSSVKNLLYNEIQSITKDLIDQSPIDKDVFKQNWRSLKVNTPGVSSMFSMRIENKTPYGVFLDQGAEPGQAPWYFPSSNPPSGKLTLANGKVWAGGLSPFGFVIGGMIDKVIYYNTRRVDRIARDLANLVEYVI